MTALVATSAGNGQQKLFWSERGRIACESHAPYRGSDTWIYERWQPLRAADRAAWIAELGSEPQCESAGAFCSGVKVAR